MDARDRKEQDRGQHDLGESGPIVSRERGGHLGSGERNVRKKTHRQRQARYAIRQAGAWNDGSQTHALITCDVRIFTSHGFQKVCAFLWCKLLQLEMASLGDRWGFCLNLIPWTTDEHAVHGAGGLGVEAGGANL